MINLPYIDGGKGFDFGLISEDYATYRDIYPDIFFDKIINLGLCSPGKTVLDLGTGTGVLPRHLAGSGAKFVGVDISEKQIEQARALSGGLGIDYVVSPAEEVDFPDHTFDTVLACMCFTYFNKPVLLPRLARMLKKGGRLAVMSLVWLPRESDIAKGSEELVLKYNPSWNGVRYDRPKFNADGIPSTYDIDLSLGFMLETAFSFDVPVRFTSEGWHGRIKATRGLAASAITAEQRARFDQEHLQFLKGYPKTFDVMHSATFCILRTQVS